MVKQKQSFNIYYKLIDRLNIIKKLNILYLYTDLYYVDKFERFLYLMLHIWNKLNTGLQCFLIDDLAISRNYRSYFEYSKYSFIKNSDILGFRERESLIEGIFLSGLSLLNKY
jgi:hypothetical protein